MREIALTRGQVTLVDDDMYEELNCHKWHAAWDHKHWYAARWAPTINGKRHKLYMHRVITDAQPGQDVDHEDRDGLNNRRDNLRLCTSSQNNANSRKRVGCSSRYKGVTWHKQTSKWQAQIKAQRTQIYLGLFDDEWEAALSYNEAATEHFGEFARLNRIEGST